MVNLTQEYRVEDGNYRRKYNAKRRQVKRLKSRLTKWEGIYAEEKDDAEEEDSPEEATVLAMLATQATVLPANKMERESAHLWIMCHPNPSAVMMMLITAEAY
jgi:hypothetical protein